jgi:multidrug efflux pump subunit AcrA (membrane-fusion protein)
MTRLLYTFLVPPRWLLSRISTTGAAVAASCAVLVAASTACGPKPPAAENGAAKAAAAPIAASPTAVVEQPITRFIRATGSLTAEEQAEVAAEIAGRIIAAPVERGSRVAAGAELLTIAPAEADAQLKEAEANAAQIEARLGMSAGSPFDPAAVPEVQNARASYELARSEFGRIESLLAQRVVSQSEFEQRRTQTEATRQMYESAKNTAAQQYQALQGARARVTLARKALADTVVRAPFDGLVASRTASVGDYVTRGMRLAVVVRVDPLRAELTIPEQFVSAIGAGQPITFEVDAYPGRQFQGKVRFIAPALEANQRALTVEAIVPNASGELKPGLFATARIDQPNPVPGLLVPAAAVQTTAGTSRVFVVVGDHVEERIVTVGQTVGPLVEIANGLKAGERVATTNVARLTDGAKVS